MKQALLAVGALLILGGAIGIIVYFTMDQPATKPAKADPVKDQFNKFNVVQKPDNEEYFSYNDLKLLDSFTPVEGHTWKIGGGPSAELMKNANETVMDEIIDFFDRDDSNGVSWDEFKCLVDPECGGVWFDNDPEKAMTCGCKLVEGKRFPDQCKSSQWAGEQDTRIVKAGKKSATSTGDILSPKIAALSHFYNAYAVGVLDTYTNDCANAHTIDPAASFNNNKAKHIATFATLNQLYGVDQTTFTQYCMWFADHPSDECQSGVANDYTDVMPNCKCKQLNKLIYDNWGSACQGYTNNQCAKMQRELCTLTVKQNPSHITDVAKQWGVEDFMTVTGAAGNRCQWMAYLKFSNPFGQCIDHTCAGLNNGDCTLQSTGGRCVWLEKGDYGCFDDSGNMVQCETHGCYTSPCNNPAVNSRQGCRATWAAVQDSGEVDPITGAPIFFEQYAKYKCVWCTKKKAMPGGTLLDTNQDVGTFCPTGTSDLIDKACELDEDCDTGFCNPKSKRCELVMGGCGGCTNAGYLSQEIDETKYMKRGLPTCGLNKQTCELKSDAKCASIRSCKGKGNRGKCVRTGDKNGKPCYCAFTNVYCMVGKEYDVVDEEE